MQEEIYEFDGVAYEKYLLECGCIDRNAQVTSPSGGTGSTGNNNEQKNNIVNEMEEEIGKTIDGVIAGLQFSNRNAQAATNWLLCLIAFILFLILILK